MFDTLGSHDMPRNVRVNKTTHYTNQAGVSMNVYKMCLCFDWFICALNRFILCGLLYLNKCLLWLSTFSTHCADPDILKFKC